MKHSLKLFLIGFILSSILSSAAQAEFKPVKIFSLSDGTTIKGAIIGIRTSDGAYMVETSTLGTVAIAPDEVVSMTNDGMPTAPAQIQIPDMNSGSSGAMQQAQQLLLSDPAINQSMQELLADPEIAALLQDPEVMRAMTTMDPATIQSNPKVQELMKNPKMQAIIGQAGQKLMNQGATAPSP
jgi:hypothetical protein